MSKTDELLVALLNGEDVSKFECKSRVEHLLKKCCMCEVCDDIEPRTRTEYLLKELSIKMNSGGSVDIAAALSEDY